MSCFGGVEMFGGGMEEAKHGERWVDGTWYPKSDKQGEGEMARSGLGGTEVLWRGVERWTEAFVECSKVVVEAADCCSSRRWIAIGGGCKWLCEVASLMSLVTIH